MLQPRDPSVCRLSHADRVHRRHGRQALTHREAAQGPVLEASGRVVDPLAKVPDAAADGAHAKGGPDVVQDAVRARLSAGVAGRVAP